MGEPRGLDYPEKAVY